MNIRDYHNTIGFEIYLILRCFELFGLVKTIRFIIGLPSVLFTKRNRSAYKFMGECNSLINGKLIKWKHPDIRFIDELISNLVYNPNENFSIKEDYTVIDAGANVGVFTLFAASQALKGKIFSIEPFIEDYKRLEENVKANGYTNVVMINAALSSDSAPVTYDGLLCHRVDPQLESIKDQNLCNSITIDEIIEKYNLEKIHFLKMDIEGFEFEVFKESDWLDNVDVISMELHPHLGDKNKILDILKNNNFNVNTKIIDGTLYCYAKKLTN